MFLFTLETPSEKAWLEKCYQSYHRLCRIAAQYFVKGDTENQDAVQNVYLKLADRPKHFRSRLDPVRFQGFLVVMTKHCAVDLLRRRRKLYDAEPYEDEAYSSDPCPCPEGRGFADRFAEQDWAQQCLRKLKEDQLAALVLHFALGFGCKEVAKLLSRKETDARSLVYRSKALLKKKLLEAME